MSFPFDVQLTGGEEFTTSTDKEHRVGMRGVTEDGRIFRYCRASSNGITWPYWAGQSSYEYNTTDLDDTINGAVVTAAVAGDFTLDTLEAVEGTHAVDFFADGHVAVTIGSKLQFYRIKSNTYSGTTQTLTLYAPLPIAIATGSVMQVYPSNYASIDTHHGKTGSSRKPFVCVPVSSVTGSDYFWGETWGECYGIPSSTFPSGVYQNRLVFLNNGALDIEGVANANLIHQRAGYKFFDYNDVTEAGSLLYYMLEIRP